MRRQAITTQMIFVISGRGRVLAGASRAARKQRPANIWEGIGPVHDRLSGIAHDAARSTFRGATEW